LDAAWLLPLLYSAWPSALTAILWPTRWTVRWRTGAKLALEGRDLRVYRWSRIAAVAIIGTLAAWFGMVTMMFGRQLWLGAGCCALVARNAQPDRIRRRPARDALVPLRSGGANGAGLPRSGALRWSSPQ
jgi:hypothetical protein